MGCACVCMCVNVGCVGGCIYGDRRLPAPSAVGVSVYQTRENMDRDNLLGFNRMACVCSFLYSVIG